MFVWEERKKKNLMFSTTCHVSGTFLGVRHVFPPDSQLASLPYSDHFLIVTAVTTLV